MSNCQSLSKPFSETIVAQNEIIDPFHRLYLFGFCAKILSITDSFSAVYTISPKRFPLSYTHGACLLYVVLHKNLLRQVLEKTVCLEKVRL